MHRRGPPSGGGGGPAGRALLAASARKRLRPVGLMDLPHPLLEDIILRVADSGFHVDDLPPPGGEDGLSPTFLSSNTAQAVVRNRPDWLTFAPSVDYPYGLPMVPPPPPTPSAVITRCAWRRSAPLRATCRLLNRLGHSAVCGVVMGPCDPSLSTMRMLRAFPRLRFVVARGNRECTCTECFSSLAPASLFCSTANAIREESLLPEGVRRLSLSGLSYHGQLLPSGLLQALFDGASARCLKRLVLEGLEDERVGLRLGQALRALAPTLVELALLLPLGPTFFHGALLPSSTAARHRPVCFPALRRLGLLGNHPADAAVMVRSAPALTSVLFSASVVWTDGRGAGRGRHRRRVLSDALLNSTLASTVGRLSALAICGVSPFAALELTSDGVLEWLRTHGGNALRSVRAPCLWGPRWMTASFPEASFGRLSLLDLSLCDFWDGDLGPLLDRLAGGAPTPLFPALTELRLEVALRKPWGGAESLQCRLPLCSPREGLVWELGPPRLVRLQLLGPLEMMEAVLESVASRSLTAMVLAVHVTDPQKMLRTQSVAGLANRCPALSAVRLERLSVSGRLVELLDLQDLRGVFANCRMCPPWPRLADCLRPQKFFACDPDDPLLPWDGNM